jgi:hypothetical protein
MYCEKKLKVRSDWIYLFTRELFRMWHDRILKKFELTTMYSLVYCPKTQEIRPYAPPPVGSIYKSVLTPPPPPAGSILFCAPPSPRSCTSTWLYCSMHADNHVRRFCNVQLVNMRANLPAQTKHIFDTLLPPAAALSARIDSSCTMPLPARDLWGHSALFEGLKVSFYRVGGYSRPIPSMLWICVD